jgi:ankyrin repeat protein
MNDDTPDPALIELANALLDAARQGDGATVRAFLDRGAPVNLRDSAGNTPLMLAAYHGHADLVGELAARGESPLAGAAFKGFTDVAAALLEAGADPSLGEPSGLATAQYFERAEIVALIEARQA